MEYLSKDDYHKCLPLIEDVIDNRALLHALVSGQLEGKIFVDQRDAPKVAFINWEFSFLVGDDSNTVFNNELLAYVKHEVIANDHVKEFVLFIAPGKFKEVQDVLEGFGCIQIERKMFHFDVNTFYDQASQMKPLGNGYKLRQLNDNEVGHQDNFGFVITKEDEIVSRCESVAVAGQEAEIDIETLEDYQGKGLAKHVAIAFINECIANDLTPNWSCWPFREGSIHLAKSLGFTEKCNLPVILWAEDL